MAVTWGSMRNRPGSDGLSAYEIAVQNGGSGTEAEWVASLDGQDGLDGADGASAYEVAVANGFVGTEAEWLTSLHGTDGVDGRRVEAATLTSGSDGRVTFVFPVPFTVAPTVVATVNDTNTGDNVWYDWNIVSVTTTQAIVQVFRTQAVEILGIVVLGAKTSAGSGRTVHVVAVDQA